MSQSVRFAGPSIGEVQKVTANESDSDSHSESETATYSSSSEDADNEFVKTTQGQTPAVGSKDHEERESDDEEDKVRTDNISLMSKDEGGEILDICDGVQELLKKGFAPPP